LLITVEVTEEYAWLFKGILANPSGKSGDILIFQGVTGASTTDLKLLLD
jgi:hypothetical protein